MSDLWNRMRFTRDHRWAPDHMSAYLDGELAVSLSTRIERHVDECPECHQLLASLRRMVNALHHLPAPPGAVDVSQIAASVRLRLQEPTRPD